MNAPELVIAEAITDGINGRDWSRNPLATRVYQQDDSLLEPGELRVFVFAWALATETSARGFIQEEHTTWLLITERLQDRLVETIDARIEFARELREWAESVSLPYDADVVRIETDNLYDADKLDKDSLFLHSFAVVWRLDR